MELPRDKFVVLSGVSHSLREDGQEVNIPKKYVRGIYTDDDAPPLPASDVEDDTSGEGEDVAADDTPGEGEDVAADDTSGEGEDVAAGDTTGEGKDVASAVRLQQGPGCRLRLTIFCITVGYSMWRRAALFCVLGCMLDIW